MKRFWSPNSTTVLRYSSASLECLERPGVLDDTESYISGGLTKSGSLAWLVRGATLEVVNVTDGSRQAAWRFGWSSKQQRPVCITSVVELQIEDGAKLLVGLKDLSTSNGGIVCLFDLNIGRVIKAIEIPHPVTVVEGVTNSGGADGLHRAFSKELRLLFGIAAIGTEQGHCFLLDLRLDDESEEFDEWHTSQIEVMDLWTGDIAQHRDGARTNGTHLGLELGGGWHAASGSFAYVNPDSSESHSLSSDEVDVTAIEFVKLTCCILVGFNFGCFQIWNLETLTHIYSSQFGKYYSPVSHFMYQEPENDPRYCCYLWVARGPLVPESSPETPATLTLYQMLYASRGIVSGYGIIYRELTGVGGRFEHQLTGDARHLADSTSVGSKVICCYTLEKDVSTVERVDESAVLETGRDKDLTLCVCVWEAPSHEPCARPTCHLGIFDINCWYHSQMPPSIRDAMFGSKDPNCPFFAFFSLAEVLNAAPSDGIVDVFVDPKSISNFISSDGSTLEQHTRPASLKFDACCLMETGLVQCKFLGVQRQILANMCKEGTGCLADGHEYFNMCYTAGLLPRNFNLSVENLKSPSFHYKALFSVALEHGMVHFVTSCIQKLGTGTASYAGCSLKLLLDWAWERAVEIKEQWDQLCVPLFDGGGGTPDEQMLLMLDKQKLQLGHLVTIFQALITQSTVLTTQQGLEDLEAKHNVVHTLSGYLKIISWFIGQGLLPELSEGVQVPSRRGMYFPADSLSSACESHRNDLALLGKDPSCGILLVDKLIEQLGNPAVSQWITKGGTDKYPPMSLHGLCSLYLLEKVKWSSKLSIVFYVLLDLSVLDEELQRNEVAIKFGKRFNMCERLMKLIYGFWLLDHKHFEAAVTCLVEPLIYDELGPWASSFILKTLLIQGEYKRALYFMKTLMVQPSVECSNDIKLLLSVLLADRKVTEAFNFQRMHQYPSTQKELHYHFFTGCQQSGNLDKLCELPLDSVEEDSLERFLAEESFPGSRELLVMHYLQRQRFVDGIRQNERLKKNRMAEDDDKAKVRNAIADAHMKCLPRVQRQLVYEPVSSMLQQRRTFVEVPRPKPLSTVVHQVDRPSVSRAVLLNAAMDKMREISEMQQVQELQRYSPLDRSVKRRSESVQPEPFVCTPVMAKSRSRLSDRVKTDVVFASAKKRVDEEKTSSVSEKRPSESHTLPRFMDKERRRQFTGAEALSLLATPPVSKLTRGSAMAKTDYVKGTTPQSILKIGRVLRRSSPQPSPTSSPPVARRASSDKPSKPPESTGPSQSQPVETPSRRLRFATENSPPSPPSTVSPVKSKDDVTTSPIQPSDDVTASPIQSTDDIFASLIQSRDDVSASSNKSIFDVTMSPTKPSGDIAVSSTKTNDEVLEPAASEDAVDTSRSDVGGETKLERVEAMEVTTDASTSKEDTDGLQPVLEAGREAEEDTEVQIAVLELTGESFIGEAVAHGEDDNGSYYMDESDRDNGSEDDSAAVSSEADATHADENNSDQHQSSFTSIRTSPVRKTPPATPETAPVNTEDVTISRSPFPLSERQPSVQKVTQPSLVSPPLTRLMARRRSGVMPLMGGDRGKAASFTPHQSPSNSPISFVSPVPQSSSLRKSARQSVSRKRLVKPMHSMTLRSRRAPTPPTKSATLPYTKLSGK